MIGVRVKGSGLEAVHSLVQKYLDAPQLLLSFLYHQMVGYQLFHNKQQNHMYLVAVFFTIAMPF
jgi:hypothetical protein